MGRRGQAYCVVAGDVDRIRLPAGVGSNGSRCRISSLHEFNLSVAVGLTDFYHCDVSLPSVQHMVRP